MWQAAWRSSEAAAAVEKGGEAPTLECGSLPSLIAPEAGGSRREIVVLSAVCVLLHLEIVVPRRDSAAQRKKRGKKL